jgi:hypothetical protein
MDNSKEIATAIKNKIHYKRTDTLINHLKTYFQLDQMNYSGSLENNKFSIWCYSSSTGIFYVVIDGQIVTENGKTKVILSARPNKAGVLLTAIISCCFCIAAFSVKFDSFNMVAFLSRLFFAAIPIIESLIIYSYLKPIAITDVEQVINGSVRHVSR